MAKKIKIEGDLYDRLEKYSEVAGYSTADEFIVHVLEKSVADMEKSADEESVKERLMGLGYLG
jgi:metal-responsive CopG/Arc/MetJ family transcriptional regulator